MAAQACVRAATDTRKTTPGFAFHLSPLLHSPRTGSPSQIPAHPCQDGQCCSKSAAAQPGGTRDCTGRRLTLGGLVGRHKAAGVLAMPQNALHTHLQVAKKVPKRYRGWKEASVRATGRCSVAPALSGARAATCHHLKVVCKGAATSSKACWLYAHLAPRLPGLLRRRVVPPLGGHPASVDHHCPPAAVLAQGSDEQVALRAGRRRVAAAEGCAHAACRQQ